MGSTKGRIPIFRLSFDAEFRKKFHEGCDRILDEGFLTNHTYVRDFESRFAQATNRAHAVAVANGTAALEVALRALNVRGKTVLLPANTFIATAVAVLNAGGNPELLDLDPVDLGINPEELSRRFSAGKNLGAVIAVHIGGLMSPKMPELAQLCARAGVPLVEDCAHAFGSTVGGVQAGTFGAAGCYSLFPTKVLTAGEGGVAVFADKRLADEARSVRQFGADLNELTSHVRDGSNFKLTEFQALLGALDLERAPARIEKRRALAARYQKNLKNTGWKALAAPANTTCSHYKQIVLPPAGLARSQVEAHFDARGIALTGGIYRIPLHRQPVYAERFRDAHLPQTDRFAEAHICPPCYPELDLAEVDEACATMVDLHP